jgi:DNA-binding NarL/FixJ family response regulator
MDFANAFIYSSFFSKAEKLFISVKTVGNHRSNMIERLGARDTTALVQLAKMMGMI